MTSPQAKRKYTREQIRRARKCPLKPVLELGGHRLRRLPEGNYEVLGLGEPVVVKEHYWTCPDTGEAGNAIDFMMRFHGLSFAEAMDLLA